MKEPLSTRDNTNDKNTMQLDIKWPFSLHLLPSCGPISLQKSLRKSYVHIMSTSPYETVSLHYFQGDLASNQGKFCHCNHLQNQKNAPYIFWFLYQPYTRVIPPLSSTPHLGNLCQNLPSLETQFFIFAFNNLCFWLIDRHGWTKTGSTLIISDTEDSSILYTLWCVTGMASIHNCDSDMFPAVV